ncbi:hypothetical protein GA0070610_1736 [Micromonospora echinofusca]|uniref:DUF7680 domain-containing protein n=1 Tax=Micromonospora echinofusca TaxID=47858 RepID=A0A1C5G7F8_MICEH|nr:hypothetical protein [Micromonospora echinofusca]SCG15502.1 hypothetical protein GA0070610_1736 [Micromonospora echinofusca]
MTRSETYSCLIERDDDGRVTALSVAAQDLDGSERHVRVNGYRAIHVAAGFQEVLRSARLRGRDLTSADPIRIDPQLGAHVELVLRAVKPLKRIDRISTVSEAVAGMSREEAAYWHAQINRRNGLRALRLLLGEGPKR